MSVQKANRSSLSSTEEVIKLLSTYQWTQDGVSYQQRYRIITQESYPLPGGEIVQGGKPRFKKGVWKVSVGKRTTYFYKPSIEIYYNWEGVGFKTKDISKILLFLQELESNEIVSDI